MKHFTSPAFWELFNKLPVEIQRLASAKFELLKSNPQHPSLHFKKAGHYWSVRVGLAYRALGREVEGRHPLGLDWVACGIQQDPSTVIAG